MNDCSTLGRCGDSDTPVVWNLEGQVALEPNSGANVDVLDGPPKSTARAENSTVAPNIADSPMRIVEFGVAESTLTVVVPTSAIGGRWFQQCAASIPSMAGGLHPTIIAVESSGSEFNFSRSVNAGISRAKGDVLILNDDACLAKGALEAILSARENRGEGVYQ